MLFVKPLPFSRSVVCRSIQWLQTINRFPKYHVNVIKLIVIFLTTDVLF